MLQGAIASALALCRFGSSQPFLTKACVSGAWTLRDADFSRGVTYKTHDYPDALAGREQVKAIFIYGSALESARSAYSLGDEWMSEHAVHLKRPGVTRNDLRSRDALGFLDQATAWFGFAAVPTLCVRYEALWDHVQDLCAFTGLPLALPTRGERSAKVLPADIEHDLAAVFAPIDAKLAELPTLSVRGG